MDFVGKVMSLVFNMLSRLVITLLPRSKRLYISWLQSPSAVILKPPKIKSGTVSTVSPSISHEEMPKDSQESSPTPQFKSINSSALSFLYSSTLTSIHGHWKNHSLDYMDFVGKVMFLHFNMLSRLVITFLPRSRHLLISWLQSPSAVILEPKK